MRVSKQMKLPCVVSEPTVVILSNRSRGILRIIAINIERVILNFPVVEKLGISKFPIEQGS